MSKEDTPTGSLEDYVVEPFTDPETGPAQLAIEILEDYNARFQKLPPSDQVVAAALVATSINRLSEAVDGVAHSCLRISHGDQEPTGLEGAAMHLGKSLDAIAEALNAIARSASDEHE